MTKLFILLFFTPFYFVCQNDATKNFTKQLCSPEFHGRGYVNNGDIIAADFIAQTFKDIGVSIINGSYFQEFSFPVNTFPGEMLVKINNKELTPGIDYIVDASSTGGEYHLKPVFIDGSDLLSENKIQTIFNDNQETIGNSIFVVNNTKYSADSTKKIKRLIKDLNQLVAVAEITNEKFIWSVGRKTTRFPILKVKESALPKNTQTIDLKIDQEFIPNHMAKNVIGYIPSKRKNSKSIVFSAHYDHLGRMGSQTYFPGANDNASGTAMLVHLAKYFIENPSKYNIYFMAFAGEEAGLIGSYFMSENPVLDLKKIAFVLNLDIMGSGEEGITVVNGRVHKKAYNKLLRLNKKKRYLSSIKARGEAANSDHYWFSQKGVPAFFIYTRGNNKHYHDIFDTYEELNFDSFEPIANLLIKFTKTCLK